MGCGNTAVLEAAANVAWALCNTGHPAELCFAVPECNSLGAAMIGGASLEPAFETVHRHRCLYRDRCRHRYYPGK